MREYSYMSKSSNNKEKILSGALFFSAVVLLASSAVFELPYEGIFQMLCALLFTFAVLLLTRFVFKSFLLSVSLSDRDFDFTVTECRAKEKITVCRISLSNIERVCLLTDENKKELREAAKGRKSFVYYPEMTPSVKCFVFVTECGEKLLLKLSPDETMLDILKNAAKSNQKSGEEE